MDAHTRAAKKWLDNRYRRKQDGSYLAHQPIHGLATRQSEPNPILRLARTYRILTLFEGLDFNSFLDIGGGEGYFSGLVRDLFDVFPYCTDLSVEACLRAEELFGVQSLATDATRLPFKDRSYDLVLCSEVIEHLAQPVWAISELVRVARKYVVITTAESCPLGELERVLRLCLLDAAYPHAERNWFTLRDFQALLGSEISVVSQMRNLGGKISHYFAKRQLMRPQTEKALEFLTLTDKLDLDHDGMVVVLAQPEFRKKSSQAAPVQLNAVRKQQFFNRLLESPTPSPVVSRHDHPFDRALLQGLQCLCCQGRLDLAEAEIVCLDCAQRYPIQNGIPVMMINELPPGVYHSASVDPIAILSGGDAQRAESLRSLIKKLHGERPLRVNSLTRSAAKLLLRIVFFLRRPESIGAKVRRIIMWLKKESPSDYEDLDKVLLAP